MIHPGGSGNRAVGLMQTLVKVVMREWRAGGKPGDVLEFTPDFAADLVRCGGAEYVDAKREPFPRGRGGRDKMVKNIERSA